MPDCASLPSPLETASQLREIAHRHEDFNRNTAAVIEQAAQLIEQMQMALRDAEAQHRTEYCEAAQYDCVLLGKERKLREMYAAELVNMRAERNAMRRLCREHGIFPEL